MKLIINGAGGRMGKALRSVIEKRENDTIVAAIDPFVKEDGMLGCLTDFTGDADCILDFSNHAGITELLKYACSKKLHVVVATTGHTPEELCAIRDAAKEIPVFHSGNMSLGVNLQIELIQPNGKPSAWQEYLDEYGEGMHHLAFPVSDTEQKVISAEAFGMPCIQRGKYGDASGEYAYFDAREKLKCFIETLENY